MTRLTFACVVISAGLLAGWTLGWFALLLLPMLIVAAVLADVLGREIDTRRWRRRRNPGWRKS